MADNSKAEDSECHHVGISKERQTSSGSERFTGPGPGRIDRARTRFSLSGNYGTWHNTLKSISPR